MNLESKTIRLRLVSESDAEFILNLRLNGELNRFLSAVNPSLQDQINWIKKYKADEEKGSQFYFIIEKLDKTPCGTVRIYDLRVDSFCWGSWILNNDKTRFSALESAFLVYQFGFESLGFKKSHFDVMKENSRVVSFHKKMGAIQVGEDDESFKFEISKEAVAAKKEELLGKFI